MRYSFIGGKNEIIVLQQKSSILYCHQPPVEKDGLFILYN